LPSSQFGIFVVSLLPKIVGSLSGEPGPNSALYVESSVFALLSPHFRRKVVFIGSDDLIFSSVHVQPGFFALNSKANIHLNAHFSHHDGRLSFILVSLHHSFVFLGVIVCLLIGLGKSVVIGLPSSIVSETTEVGFQLISFFNFNSHTFYLKEN